MILRFYDKIIALVLCSDSNFSTKQAMLRTVVGAHAKCAVLLDPKSDPLLCFSVPRKADAA